LESLKESIKDFTTKMPNYLFVANLDGDWNMLVVMKVEQEQKEPSLKIVEKFSDDISDYRISDFDVRGVNLLNMSLLLL